MCQLKQEFKLCSCVDKAPPKIIHHKKSKRHRLKQEANSPPRPPYTWTLCSFVSYYEPIMEGLTDIPSDVLGDRLEQNYVLEKLNAANCFDFDYLPQEGDCLYISYRPQNQGREFMSFAYKNGLWIPYFYDPFSTTLQKINFGDVDFGEEATEL